MFCLLDVKDFSSFSDTTEFSESIQNFTTEAVEVESPDKIDEGDEENKGSMQNSYLLQNLKQN